MEDGAVGPPPAAVVPPSEEKVAIIGAGFSGLGVAAVMQRRGIPFDVFEANGDLGGNWLHGVYENVHIISSRKTTAYGDFPMPASYPDFPSAAQMLDYLRRYADHHRLRPRIRFNTTVLHVEPRPDEKWDVTLSTGETLTYKGVVACNGHLWAPRYPSIPGAFAGEIIHSKEYKTPEQLRGKRVLVIGGGNSGCDIAVEAARAGRSADISLRRGYWFLPRTVLGIPLPDLMHPIQPMWFQRITTRLIIAVVFGGHRKYGLQRPDHRLFDHHPTINSDLLHYVKLGRITPRPGVRRFDGAYVEFEDGTRDAFDLVVYATGFEVRFPFFSEDLLAWKNGVPQLLALTVHPRYKNLFVIGLHQVRYGVGPLITAGAEAVCSIIETQEHLRQPVGTLLTRLGMRPPDSLLTGPFQVMRTYSRLRRYIRLLPRLEALLGAR